jgi:hypothetical protein
MCHPHCNNFLKGFTMKNPPPLTDAQKAQILGDDARKPLAFAVFRQQSPPRLISLWNMFRVSFAVVYPHWTKIQELARHYETAAYDPALKNASLTPDQHLLLRRAVVSFRTICRECDLHGTLRQVEQFQETIDHHGTDAVSINNLLKNLISTMETEMSEIYFIRIPTLKAGFFEQDALFGPSVEASFPEAREEIKSAGNCLAADLNTAAVFHLMRASEVGLRALSQKLNAWTKPFPVEFAQWHEVIEEIKNELNKKELALQQTGKGPQKDAALEHCRALLADVNHLKLSRDRVMHTRGNYNSDEAQGVFRRVNEFMNRLSTV